MKTDDFKAIAWKEDHICILDQTKLPRQEVYLECRDLDSICNAIKRLSIRGAPAIGVTAAMALAFVSQSIDVSEKEAFLRQVDKTAQRLLVTRPTAVNLRWAVQKMRDVLAAEKSNSVETLKQLMKQSALSIARQDMDINRQIGEQGQLIVPPESTIMTICNTGSLATGGHGTALGVVRTAVEHGKQVFVAVCETRPLLQGARLTAWELQKDRIPFVLITDSMAGHFMLKRGADAVIAGADRIAANGDSANKIGTYALSILAKAHSIPFYIAAPTSTIDMTISSGNDIPIEERDPEEITKVQGQCIAPESIPVWNPAFDVVPADNISGIITEKKIVRAPFEENIKDLC